MWGQNRRRYNGAKIIRLGRTNRTRINDLNGLLNVGFAQRFVKCEPGMTRAIIAVNRDLSIATGQRLRFETSGGSTLIRSQIRCFYTRGSTQQCITRVG